MTYTNCEAVELLLNDKSIGRVPVDPIEMAQWTVAYQPGVLKAIAYTGSVRVAEATVRTTGPAAALGLEVHPAFGAGVIPADGHFALPITVFATDDQGHRVPTADVRVDFAIDGPAKILGVGNGDPTCHEPDKASARSLFNGLAQVIVQTTTTPGAFTLTATSPGLRQATLTLPSTPAAPRPSVPAARVRYFVTGWRRSPISTAPPDPNQHIAEHDMNSWERITPGPSATHESGYAIYRATVRPPKVVQSHGGRIVLRNLSGEAEIYLAGKRVDSADEIPLAAADSPVALSLLIQGPGGLTESVEIVPN
jgi:beta-galactosidase